MLTIGVIIGITVCLILSVILIITISLVVFRRKKLFRQRAPPPPPPPRRSQCSILAAVGPVVCRADDPATTGGRVFMCTEPPPPYTAFDNLGFQGTSPGYPAPPAATLSHLPNYKDVAIERIPGYASLTRSSGSASGSVDSVSRRQNVSFTSGVIGPESVGGEVPVAVVQRGRRPNLPTLPTLSGYGANTVTISFGSRFEPPPSYDISIIATPRQIPPSTATNVTPRVIERQLSNSAAGHQDTDMAMESQEQYDNVCQDTDAVAEASPPESSASGTDHALYKDMHVALPLVTEQAQQKTAGAGMFVQLPQDGTECHGEVSSETCV